MFRLDIYICMDEDDEGFIHWQHCLHCVQLSCQVTQQQCEITECPECRHRAHKCKMDEHLMFFCPKIAVPCLNAAYGCKRRVRRDHLTHHLKSCPASVVVCTREWSRRTNTAETKVQLKKYAKRRAKIPREDVPEESIDLLCAVQDQAKISEMYGYSRAFRVHQRDQLYPMSPALPLRQIFDSNGNPVEKICFDDPDENSSDEEKRIKAEKLKKKKAMFANCYMCQVDPASQHLHTLGNESAKYKLGRLVKKYPRPLEKLYEKYGLLISSVVENCSETIPKAENVIHIARGGTFYTIKCLKTVRREEFGDHHHFQHSGSLDVLPDLVVRCPNWANGCTFFTQRLKPKIGNIRYSPELDTFTHCISPPSSEPSTSTPFDELNFRIIEQVFDYLPSSSLRVLASTSRKLRESIFYYLNDRAMVEPQWKKVDGIWVQNGFKWSFSVSEQLPVMEWTNPSALSNHLSSCPFFEATDYGSLLVPVILDMDEDGTSNLPSINDLYKLLDSCCS